MKRLAFPNQTNFPDSLLTRRLRLKLHESHSDSVGYFIGDRVRPQHGYGNGDANCALLRAQSVNLWAVGDVYGRRHSCAAGWRDGYILERFDNIGNGKSAPRFGQFHRIDAAGRYVDHEG